jgi:hypothetical protein
MRLLVGSRLDGDARCELQVKVPESEAVAMVAEAEHPAHRFRGGNFQRALVASSLFQVMMAREVHDEH